MNVPAGSTSLSSLPVMVYIHGGANMGGASSAKLQDTSNLVRRSIQMGKPVVLVSLNYRVNYFGFAWVKDGAANNGLHDLVNGFRWVKKHIAGFGGNADQITAFGESAGSMSVDALLQGRQGPLFRRAIMQSGVVASAPPKSRAEHDAIVAHLAKASGVDQGRSGWQAALQSVPVVKVLAALESSNLAPMPYADDGDFFNAPWEESAAKWVDSIMIGDCEFEAALYMRHMPGWSTDVLVKNFMTSSKYGPALMKAYGLSTKCSDDEAKQIALRFLNDAVFAHAGHALARRYKAIKVPVYQYIFDQTNPFNPTARAHHAVDLMYTFKAFDLTHAADTTAEAFSRQAQEKWITYGIGGHPWEAGTCFAFGPQGETKDAGTQRTCRAT